MTAKKNYNKIYQFKITLLESKPLIWRKIQVPENFTFWDLHVAIQDAMGWYDCHLHHFRTIGVNPRDWQYIGIPFDEDDEERLLEGWEENISAWFDLKKKKAMIYEYDFGDGWQHRVELEKILPREPSAQYPICIGGKRSCPPEDCGGIGGYENLLEIIDDPSNEEHKEIMEWLGNGFDPEEFDAQDVDFSSSKARLKELLKNI